MKKDLMIVDVQSHYTRQDTKSYCEKLTNHINKNIKDINIIHVVVDLMHEDNGMDFDFDEITEQTAGQQNYSLMMEEITVMIDEIYEDYTDEEKDGLFETFPHYEKYEKYVYEDRLPFEFARDLIIAEYKHGKEINIINKTYGYFRCMIDNQIEGYPYLLKLYQILTQKYEIHDMYDLSVEELMEFVNKDKVIEIVYQKIKKIFKVSDDDIVQELEDSFRGDFEEIEDRYLYLLKEDETIMEIFGGGAMECFYEEVTSMLAVQDYHKTNKKIEINYDLVYGDISNTYDEDYDERNIKQALIKFKNRIVDSTKPIKKTKKTKNK